MGNAEMVFVAPKVRKMVFGLGCLLQGAAIVGFAGVWHFAPQLERIVGVAVAITVLLIGIRLSRQWRCGACGDITSATAKACTGCHSEFDR